MKMTYVQTYSLAELAEQGYKQSSDESEIYLGNARYPTNRLRADRWHLLGKKLEVCGVEEDGDVYVKCPVMGTKRAMPFHFIKGPVPKVKLQKFIVGDRVAVFDGYGFKFPCEARELDREATLALAHWVLKVGK